ncbi:DUF4255 domain-containing protein [Desulfosporosinus sp. BG]|uniref:DUF4255 domain-containing protein n=1 Tax=Desulfosporosinus sp. BG TaxID=1633135 RepID=UPI00083ABA86|nr:DUF4255 domain-containing protein [Desulfosporosinus sp. BG]ODA40658.1 Nitrogen regulation protein NR(I) [Desulfosporosinus sp. BG]
MSEFTVFADIGQTLIKLLRDNMKDLNMNENSIVLCSPADVTDDISLSIFLYQVVENSDMRNQDMFELGPDRLQYPPLYLDLYYLLTTYSKADLASRSLEEHRILGKAMSILHDHVVLSGPALQGGLAGKHDEFRISMNTLSLDDANKLWSTFTNKQFRPSVSYLVTPVAVDSTRIMGTSRVLSRELEYNVMGEDR